jgi:hypothetical protein
MEKLLYTKVFEKGVGMKSASTLGQLSSFLSKDIDDVCNYVINPKTLLRGFRIYVESEILIKYRSSYSYVNYSPHVDTLKILSIYMGYESFSDFCQKNKVEEKEVEQPKQKNNITVYQQNNGKVFGDVKVKESIIFNFKK